MPDLTGFDSNFNQKVTQLSTSVTQLSTLTLKEGSDYLSDLFPNDKPWDSHKAVADAVRALYKSARLDKYADRIQKCGQLLEFALRSDDQGDVGIKLQSAQFCRVRHCPVCQWRRSMKWQAKMFTAMPQISKTYPKYRWVFLTLTVKNCAIANLRDTVKSMNDAFARLTKLVRFPAIGWIKSVEVTRNAKTGEAHPHFHCLMLVPSGYFGGKGYIKQDEWRLLWQRSLRVDYLPLINIKAVKPRPNKVDGSFDDISQAIVETLKYSVKESDLVADEYWLTELTAQLHQTRAIAIGGVLKEFLKEEKEDEDLIHIEESDRELIEDDSIKIYFGWREALKRYKKQDKQMEVN